jgi:hypothetical protein
MPSRSSRGDQSDGRSIEHLCFLGCGGDTGETFSADLLGQLASLNVDLGINVYDDRGSAGQNAV